LRKILAAVLILIELLFLLVASAAAIFFLQPYGHRAFPALAITAIVAFLALVTRRSSIDRSLGAGLPTQPEKLGAGLPTPPEKLGAGLPTPPGPRPKVSMRFTRQSKIDGSPGLFQKSQRWARRFIPPGQTASRYLRIAAKTLIGTLTCWLGLIAWSSLSSGGSSPPVKPNSLMIRVVTWNILHGTNRGAPWNRFGWPVRKGALRSALRDIMPDILCVQEALEEQVNDLVKMRLSFGQVGVGRDDGRSAGEYCAIFFDRDRFDEYGGGTFWLEEPSSEPPVRTNLGPKRICTWIRLRDRESGQFLRVYNTHQYLTEQAQLRAARIILERIAQGDPADAVVVTGDFNEPPKTAARLLFDEKGLKSSAELMSDSPAAATYQFYGIRLSSLDDILVNRECRVNSHRVLDMKPGNTFPSDHFGVMADLELAAKGMASGQ
jgi:endonuclease/exonuclease/phosphatase family metal-dependent hydrolase